ncbi:anti-sigma factor [Calothrix sp. UHCC 0171]|uniref:anti-sigma factor n=1 Tax=Calothrix sp. UHCC 0171 TaxID=3110245 RepID=UPI002B21F58C|nr:anti-sigma factor [Calothrix sp. UHCC 0171]MEA5574625.1 anti-sigma factor [Calothrix sp. UHCC 0171]
MNKSFDSEYIKNLAAGFVVDDLTPEEAEEFRLLLNQHPELITEVEDLQEVLRQVVDGFVEVEPPAYLLPKILLQVEEMALPRHISQTEQSENIVNINDIPATQTNYLVIPKISRRWTQIAGSIAALFVVILGVDYYRLRQNLSGAITENQKLRQDFAQIQEVKNLLQNSQTRLFTFEAVNSKNNIPDNASGSIVINSQKQKAVMVFQNLPAPPPGNVYLLWTIVADRKFPCGQVKPYSWGTASYELPFTEQMYQEFSHPKFSGLIVTLEQDPNVARPTGTVVMQSSQI